MYNWNIDTTRLKKNPSEYERFVLEQQINFGLNNTKLSLKNAKKYWNDLDIDPAKRNYLKKVIWPQS